jgi:hypothetical protein
MQSLGSFPINWKYNLPIALKADPKKNYKLATAE